MSSSPAFAVTPRIGFGAISTANTNRDGTGTIVDIITGAAGGTKIVEVVLQSTSDPADCVYVLYLHDGTGYRDFYEVDPGNPAAGSTTTIADRQRVLFDNLVLPSASWKLAASITVAPTAGVVNIFALGADL